jgi:PAS domain S-box-containing protein
MSQTAGALSQVRPEPNSKNTLALLRIAKQVTATLGNDFFRMLAKHLAAAVHADCAYVAELADSVSSRLRTLAVCREGQWADAFDLETSGTTAGRVLADGAFVCRKGATNLFPLDSSLADMNGEACAGVCLADSCGQPLGLIMLVFERELGDPSLAESLLAVFRTRAAAELERKRADDALKENAERYRAFISCNPDAMWRIEFQEPIPTTLPVEAQIDLMYGYGYLAECNLAMCRLAGAGRPDEFVGSRLEALVPRGDERLQNELRSMARSGFRSESVEVTALDENGRPSYRLRSQFGIVEDGALRRIWGVTRDLTDLRRAELSLAAAERRFREVLDHIQMPAVMLDRDGVVLFCNDQLLKSISKSREALIGTRWCENVIPADERDRWENALHKDPSGAEDGLRNFEGHLLTQTAHRLVLWNVTVLRNEEGELAGLAAIGQDVTEQRKLEADARRAEKLESVGLLAAGIAHDFNGLLTVIQCNADELLKGAMRSGGDYVGLAAIANSADRCAALIHQLLTIGLRSYIKPVKIDLNIVISGEERVIRALAGSAVTYSTELQPVLPQVYADPTQIQRLLANLVTNARDAMAGGGTLRIETSAVEFHETTATRPASVPAGRYVRLAVIDTGPGLSEAAKQHLFEPFFTTKRPGKGTGLGLSTVHGIVTQAKGYVALHSAPGQGTEVEMLFPALDN